VTARSRGSRASNGLGGAWAPRPLPRNGSWAAKPSPDGRLDWSPDGTKLLFTRFFTSSGGYDDLFTSAADGSNLQQLTNSAGGYADPGVQVT
jgi:Tol biopolymer transport system component